MIDIEVTVDANDAELFSGRTQDPASTVSGAKQASRTKTVRPQSEVKQVRFAMGPLEEGRDGRRRCARI